ncbi:VTT domain-containing protein [Cupriavidus cauae]|uniref:VTT domain-containing protein n=1 Tax=Cupriavidus TaxID=106589 RepID=UPI00165BDC63|nr:MULTISPECIES: VTT domain-containing protein [Cupriavidus]MCA7084048.1 VTT domain-containing protein [Cupriavidus sp. DB3]UZN50462.1 VTT domain-containing protein [Cupriavidus cauae]
MQFIDMLLHVDKYLGTVIQQYGAWVYAILFAIVFAETGLVVVPFLPGDSLLFIAGAFCATGAMNEWVLIGLLLAAAIGGNTVNYWIGSWIGPKVFDHQWRFLDQQALRKTHDFYERHGGKTLVIARFVPIVRTFAPFVAGVSQMTFARFQFFNVLGAVIWVFGLVFAGYFFGNLPFIKQYLNLIVLAGISAAIVPLILGGLWRLLRRGDKRRRVS